MSVRKKAFIERERRDLGLTCHRLFSTYDGKKEGRKEGEGTRRDRKRCKRTMYIYTESAGEERRSG